MGWKNLRNLHRFTRLEFNPSYLTPVFRYFIIFCHHAIPLQIQDWKKKDNGPLGRLVWSNCGNMMEFELSLGFISPDSKKRGSDIEWTQHRSFFSFQHLHNSLPNFCPFSCSSCHSTLESEFWVSNTNVPSRVTCSSYRTSSLFSFCSWQKKDKTRLLLA